MDQGAQLSLMFIPVGNTHLLLKIAALYTALLIESKLPILSRWFYSFLFVSAQTGKEK